MQEGSFYAVSHSCSRRSLSLLPWQPQKLQHFSWQARSWGRFQHLPSAVSTPCFRAQPCTQRGPHVKEGSQQCSPEGLPPAEADLFPQGDSHLDNWTRLCLVRLAWQGLGWGSLSKVNADCCWPSWGISFHSRKLIIWHLVMSVFSPSYHSISKSQAWRYKKIDKEHCQMATVASAFNEFACLVPWFWCGFSPWEE